MDLSKKRCGECGTKTYERRQISGQWQKQWKDYPSVFLMEPLELWVCRNCNAHAVTPGDAEKIDRAIERSIQEQTKQYLDVIKEKSGLTFDEIAVRVGIGAPYMSSIYRKKKTPGFGLWNQLKSVTMNPVEEMRRLDPNLDIFKENILFRA